MQTGYDKFEMKVHKGHGSLLVTLPYRLCERDNIKAGDLVIFHRPEDYDLYFFYKDGNSKSAKLDP